MDDTGRQVRQLRNPSADVIAGRVEFLALQNRVEDAEVGRGVGAGAGCPLPAAVVGGGVAIEQVIHEPAFAPLPVDEQIFDQERGDNHAGAVMHPAGGAQLAHGGIDNRDAGLPGFPGFKFRFIVPPGDIGEGRVKSGSADVGKVVENSDVKLTPDEFIEPGGSTLTPGLSPNGRGELPNGSRGGLTHGNHAKADVGREGGGAIEVEVVAGFVVLGDFWIGRLGELAQAAEGFAFARGKMDNGLKRSSR